jgi:outer membrane protein TolC
VPAAAQQSPAPATPVKLSDLVAEAERVHPAIQAESRMIEAKRLRVPQARALPDPTVTVGWMGDFAPFKVQNGDPSSYRAIGAMEEFPYPGKLKLRGQIAQKDVDAGQWTLEAMRRRIRAAVKTAYYELWSVEKALSITQQNKDLLQRLVRIAEEKYKVGKAAQQDVLRAQVEVTRVLQRLTVLEQRRRVLEAQINTLLLRPTEASLGPLAPIDKSPLNYSLGELLAQGVENAPEIRRQQQFIEQSQLALDLSKREFLPDFRVGYMYQQRSALPDMHGFTVGINVPIFYKSKQQQAVNEAALTRQSLEAAREALKTTLLFQVQNEYLQARASEELLNLYAKGLIPQSILALESALSAYRVGTVDFLNVISSFSAVLENEVGYYEELASYQKSLVGLEEITGLELAK